MRYMVFVGGWVNFTHQVIEPTSMTTTPNLVVLQASLSLSHTQKFSGKVSELIKQSDKSAQKLVHLLAQNFPSFCDTATYKGETG